MIANWLQKLYIYFMASTPPKTVYALNEFFVTPCSREFARQYAIRGGKFWAAYSRLILKEAKANMNPGGGVYGASRRSFRNLR
jgi:hypothetical protein